MANLDLLAGEGRITNAGAWLLARDIRKFHASAHLSCALFQGTTKTRILDRRDFASDVYSMIEGAMTWVRSKVNVHYVITGSVKRRERPELPMDAVRSQAVAGHRMDRDDRPRQADQQQAEVPDHPVRTGIAGTIPDAGDCGSRRVAYGTVAAKRVVR